MTANIVDLVAIAQNDIEAEFVCVVNQYPQYALQQCGWLDPVYHAQSIIPQILAICQRAVGYEHG